MALENVSDLELVAEFRDLLIEKRERLVLELAYIGELDRRKLFYDYPSLWAFLTLELGMEDSDAGRKIRVSRFVRKFPQFRSWLESGKLSISIMEQVMSVGRREKLSDDEIIEAGESVLGMTCRKAQRHFATLYPEPHRLPRDTVTPLTDEFWEVRFSAPTHLLEQFEEIQNLRANADPHLNWSQVLGHVFTDYLERNHPTHRAERARQRAQKKTEPSSHAAHASEPDPCVTFETAKTSEITELTKPSAANVANLDLISTAPVAPTPPKERRTPTREMLYQLILTQGYECAYVDPYTHKKCSSQRALQADHVVAYSQGGKTELQNLRFLCVSHHRRVSYLDFGESWRE